MGKLRDLRWTWQSGDTDVRVGYVAVDGRITIAELIVRMQELAPDVSLEDIEVNFATVTWTRPANAEELVARRASVDRQRARHEKWERETLARLTKKYGRRRWGPWRSRGR